MKPDVTRLRQCLQLLHQCARESHQPYQVHAQCDVAAAELKALIDSLQPKPKVTQKEVS